MMRTSKKYNYKLIRMKKTFFSLLITCSLFNFFNANHSSAQSLEIVFKNSVWGAGVGATLGVAAWFLTEEKMAKDLWSGVLRGAAVGSLFGVGYGILETEGAFSDVSQREDAKYLVEWNIKKNLVIVDTASVLSLVDASPENKFRFGVLRIPF